MRRVWTELDEEDMDEQLLAPLYWELHWQWRDGVRGSTVPWQQRSGWKRSGSVGKIAQPLPFLYFYSGTETKTEKLGRENEIGYSGYRKRYNSIGNMSITIGKRYLETGITNHITPWYVQLNIKNITRYCSSTKYIHDDNDTVTYVCKLNIDKYD